MKNARLRRAALIGGAFALSAALYMAVMALLRVTPFGDRTLLVWDADGQYLPFLTGWRRVLLGQDDALYSLSQAVGKGMAGQVSYYLASPLNALLALFPPDRLPLGYSALILLKIGLCGATAMAYLLEARRMGARGLIFAASYALMGYCAVYSWCVMWLDGVILLPLIALGLRRLWENGSPFLYLCCLALALWCSYYIGYMLCLFSALYWGYLALCRRPSGRALAASAGRFAAASLLAAGLAAAMLLPAFLSLRRGYAVADASGLDLTRLFPMARLVDKLLTGAVSYDQLRYGLPNLYIGLPMLALAAAFFLNPAFSRRARGLAAALVGVFLLSFQVRALYLLWHGLDSPNCLPARFSFLLSFVLIDLAAMGWQRLSARMSRRLLWLAAGFLLLLCVLYRGELEPYLASETLLMDALCFAAACLLLAAGTEKKSRFAALCVLQAGCLILNGYFGVHRMAIVDETTASAYAASYQDTSALIERVRAEDDGLYRMEKNFCRNENDAFTFNYHGLTYYGSDVEERSAAFLSALGLDRSYYRIQYGAGNTPVLEGFLGVKYLLWREGDSLAAPPEGYEPLWSQDGVTAYRNPCALPLAMLAPAEITADPTASADPFVNQNALLTDLTGAPVAAFIPADGLRVTPTEEGMSVSFGVRADERTYLRTAGGYLWRDDQPLEGGARYVGCVALPETETDGTCRIEALLSEGEAPAAYAHRLDWAEWTRAYDRLRAPACDVQSDTDSHFVVRAQATAGRSQLLLTLPYDEGWRAWIDGAEAEPVARYGALLAVNLPEGEHTVELRYLPSGLRTGAWIALGSLALAALWALLRRRSTTSWARRRSEPQVSQIAKNS